MKTSEAMNISFKEFNSLNKRDLSRLVSTLSATANKRLKRLSEKEVNTPAYKYAISSGGKFISKGKNLNELRAEYIRVRDFLNMKTSSLKGYRNVKIDLANRLGIDKKKILNLSENYWSDFWDLYNKSDELTPFILGSVDRQKYVFDIFIENKGLDSDELEKVLQERFNEFYKQSVSKDFDNYAELSRYVKI